MFRKTTKYLTASALSLFMIIGLSTNVYAEENNGNKAETDITISVKESSITDPGDGGDGGEGNPGGTNGQLAIWVKPSAMNFAGDYSEIKDYDLDLIVDKSTGNEFNFRRLAVADVRSKEVGWGLKAQLSDLKEVDGNEIIKDGFELSAKPKLGKYATEGDKVNIDQILDDANDVEAMENEEGRLVIGKQAAQILKASSDINKRAGKGYSSLQLNDIKMHFKSAEGFAGNFKGKVQWTLTDTPE